MYGKTKANSYVDIEIQEFNSITVNISTFYFWEQL